MDVLVLLLRSCCDNHFDDRDYKLGVVLVFQVSLTVRVGREELQRIQNVWHECDRFQYEGARILFVFGLIEDVSQDHIFALEDLCFDLIQGLIKLLEIREAYD